MTAVAVVTVVLAVLVVLILAIYLVAVIRVLGQTSARMNTVIDSLGALTEKTRPIGPAVGSINGNLSKASKLFSGLLERKLGPQEAAELVSDVDPLVAAQRTPPELKSDRPSPRPAAARVTKPKPRRPPISAATPDWGWDDPER